MAVDFSIHAEMPSGLFAYISNELQTSLIDILWRLAQRMY